MAIREYTNDAPQLALTTAVNTSAVTLAVTSTAGYPAVPFTITLERGTVNQEVVLCTALTATTFTVTRASSPKAHAIGAAVEHTTEALDYREANDHTNNVPTNPHPQYVLKTAFTTKGGILVADGNGSFVQLAVGANDRVLIADSAQASGTKWGQLGTNSFADLAVTQAKLADVVQRSLIRRQGTYPTTPSNGEEFFHTTDNAWYGFNTTWFKRPWGAGKITISTSAPSGGADGDIWLRY
jgi:hypothetical protein